MMEGGPASEEEIMNFTREGVGRYKCTRRVVFMEDLPKTAPGKVLKRELTEVELEAYT
jgi:acyl-coenzyme A synthetase/AMP-(fatty) acid ligase